VRISGPSKRKPLPDKRPKPPSGPILKRANGKPPKLLDGSGRPHKRDGASSSLLVRDGGPGPTGQPKTDHPPTGRQEIERHPRKTPTHPIEDDVHTPNRVPNNRNPIGVEIVNDNRGPKPSRNGGLALTASRPNDKSPSPSSQLNEKTPHPTSGRQNQHPLAGLDGSSTNHHGGSPPVSEQSDSGVGSQPVRHGKDGGGIDSNPLGVPTRATSAGNNPSPNKSSGNPTTDGDNHPADAITRNQRQPTSKRPTPRSTKLSLNKRDVGKLHLNDDLPNPSKGIRRLPKPKNLGPAKLPQPHSTHQVLPG
jgi:hypothetical protein